MVEGENQLLPVVLRPPHVRVYTRQLKTVTAGFLLSNVCQGQFLLKPSVVTLSLLGTSEAVSSFPLWLTVRDH